MTEPNSSGQYFSIIPHWVIFSGVSSGAIHLFAVLAKYADYDTHEAFPSRKTLAKGIGKSVDTVDRHVRELQNIGALEVKRRKKRGSQENQTNVYQLVYHNPSIQQVAAEVRPCSEHEAKVVAPVRTGVAAEVRPGGRSDAVENDTHLTKPNSSKINPLSEVPLRREESEFFGDEEMIDDSPTASRRLRSADEKVRADTETIAMLRSALGRAS